MKKTLLTKRLTLTLAEEKHVDEIVRFINRNKEFLQEWEPERTADYFTKPYQLKQIEAEKKLIENGQLYKYWIIKNGRVIGSIALNNVIYGAFESCHLGYRMDEQEQGKGYMTEALEAVMTYAFTEFRLHRIEANIMPRNLASIRVVEKAGFNYEGISKKYLKINGKWEDHIHMVALNEGME